MHIFKCCASANHRVVVPQSIPKPRPIVSNKKGLETLEEAIKEPKKGEKPNKGEKSEKQNQEKNETEVCCFCF